MPARASAAAAAAESLATGVKQLGIYTQGTKVMAPRYV
jgi:hypothetical protein